VIFQADREYLSFQRKSNLPVGESRQGPSGELGMGPAREPGTELLENRQRDSRSTQETGCLWMYRESSYSEWNDGRVREARARSKDANDSGVTDSCDLGAEPGLRKIGERGARSRKGNRPFAFGFSPYPSQNALVRTAVSSVPRSFQRRRLAPPPAQWPH
jgi:hypothetical protein